MSDLPQMTLSQAMCQTLREIGYTNYQVAEHLGMQPSEISRVVGGERELKAHHLVAIQNLVNIPLAMLLAKSMKFLDDRHSVEGAARALLDSLTLETEKIIDQRATQLRAEKKRASSGKAA